MYASYFKTGWRYLQRNTGYTLINVGGLAIGMLVAMLAVLWVYDELSFDRHHKNYHSIAQVLTNVSIDGDTVTYNSEPFPVANVLRTSYGENFDAVAASSSSERILMHADKIFNRRGAFVDEDFPRMMTFNMLRGNMDSFKGPATIMLSASLTSAMFGETDPLNKDVSINGAVMQVVGVYEDQPTNSTFYGLHYLAPMSLLFQNGASVDYWRSSSFQVYVQLKPGKNIASTSSKIRDIIFTHTQEATTPRLTLCPMERWHLYEYRNGESVAGRLDLVFMIGVIGVLILMLACINFINISTARAGQRAREVGVRKSLGSGKDQLINQFLSESFLVSAFALLLSIAILMTALPWFNNFTSKQIEIPWGNPGLWVLIVGFVLAVSLMAGSYPALYLSSFNAVRVLKGMSGGASASTPRRILVTTQFTVSVTLIIGTLVVFRQIEYVKARPVGYSQDRLLSLPLSTSEVAGRYDALRTELLKTTLVSQVSRSSSPTTDIWSSADNLSWEGKDPGKQYLFGTISIDPFFQEAVSWRIKEGRNFSTEQASDSGAFILNESAVAQMAGLGDPVGKRIQWHGKEWNVIGVAHDMIMDSPFGTAIPSVFMMDNRERPFNVINVRLNAGADVAASLQSMQAIYKRLLPNTPFDYKFADSEYATKFTAEENVSKLALLFTVIAILLSCMGLLGLASFVVELRAKEIGIRKI
jgi:hypothetical protein